VTAKNFRGVSLRATLVEQVEKTIEDHPYWNSITEFVSEAVRLRLEAVNKDCKEAS